MKRPAPISTKEWTCRRHGTQLAAGKAAKPKCRWCGTPLVLSTWTMRV